MIEIIRINAKLLVVNFSWNLASSPHPKLLTSQINAKASREAESLSKVSYHSLNHSKDMTLFLRFSFFKNLRYYCLWFAMTRFTGLSHWKKHIRDSLNRIIGEFSTPSGFLDWTSAVGRTSTSLLLLRHNILWVTQWAILFFFTSIVSIHYSSMKHGDLVEFEIELFSILCGNHLATKLVLQYSI